MEVTAFRDASAHASNVHLSSPRSAFAPLRLLCAVIVLATALLLLREYEALIAHHRAQLLAVPICERGRSKRDSTIDLCWRNSPAEAPASKASRGVFSKTVTCRRETCCSSACAGTDFACNVCADHG